MSRQTTKRRLAERETAKAEEFIEDAVEKVRTRRPRTAADYDFTSDDIIRERDHKGQSWRKVAQVLGLGNPGAARTAYTILTGVKHNESQPLVKRQPKGSFSGKGVDKPGWDDDTDQDVIIERMQGEWHPPSGEGKNYKPGHFDGSLVSVHRNHFGVQCNEDIAVARIRCFRYDYNDKLEVEVVDRETGATRIFYVTDIAQVR